MKSLLAVFLFFLHFLSFGQKDSLARKYQLIEKYPFYNSCKNCSSDSTKPMLLCGHGYRMYSFGYAYDQGHWLDIGVTRDYARCYPDIGGHLFSVALMTRTSKDLVNGLRFAYFRDHFFNLQFYFLKIGINAEWYTNYKKSDWALRPEIRLADNMDFSGALGTINISYGYNFVLSDNKLIPHRGHQISILLYFRKRGWIS